LIRCEFDEKSGALQWSLEGRVNKDVFAEYVRLSREIIPTLPVRSVILDLSNVVTFDVPPGELQMLASTPPTLPGHMPRVIVATKDHAYGLSRMFATLSEENRPNASVVRTVEEAYEWLKVEAPEFRSVVPATEKKAAEKR
jgi:hypothetical protein